MRSNFTFKWHLGSCKEYDTPPTPPRESYSLPQRIQCKENHNPELDKQKCSKWQESLTYKLTNKLTNKNLHVHVASHKSQKRAISPWIHIERVCRLGQVRNNTLRDIQAVSGVKALYTGRWTVLTPDKSHDLHNGNQIIKYAIKYTIKIPIVKQMHTLVFAVCFISFKMHMLSVDKQDAKLFQWS